MLKGHSNLIKEAADMTRMAVWIIGIALLVCAVAFAGDQPTTGIPESITGKTTSIKIVKMKATGRVVDVTDTMLKIERSVKGAVETFEFALEKPITKFNVGDKVVVRYIIKDGKNVLKEITLQRRPKPFKKIVQPRENSEPNIPLGKGSAPAK